MNLPINPPFPPMEAQLISGLPEGSGWQFEPKWDGFRCLAFRDQDDAYLQSKAGQALGRYFPEILDSILNLRSRTFVLDGELVVPVEAVLSFDALLMRIHPAQSRVRKLAAETPARLIVFDLLIDEEGRSLLDAPLSERRAALESFTREYIGDRVSILLSPATLDRESARRWLKGSGGSLDGVMAKRLDLPYKSGERTGMQKVKVLKTADCVVGGFRYASTERVVGSLLLGLYDDRGLLDHVGFVSGISLARRRDLTATLEALIEPPGFTGSAPGGPSRWSTDRSAEWTPLAPKLVVEVQYDHFTGGRFRHGCKLIRFRPDKAPRQCRMSQVLKENALSSLVLDRAA
jgi:ATP-dependent DNA ligase